MIDEWTTISVRESTRDRFNTIKQDSANEAGFNNYSSDEFVTILLDTWEDDDVMLDDDSNSSDISERLDRVESAVGTVEERTGRIERVLEELSGGHQ